MEVSKLRLSEAEAELMQNASVILTKNSILKKIAGGLESLQVWQWQQAEWYQLDEKDEFRRQPKISKGENYLGLPYFVLDYPRHSAKEHLFFIRTMFWWGNFFSVTLHLSGDCIHQYRDQLSSHFHQLQSCFIGVNEDPWVHHFNEDNYVPLSTWTRKSFEQYCIDAKHLKIAMAFPLTEWPGVLKELKEKWSFFLNACGLIADPV